MWNKLPYHSVMCDMRYIHNGIHMRGEIHFAFEDRNMAPVPIIRSYVVMFPISISKVDSKFSWISERVRLSVL